MSDVSEYARGLIAEVLATAEAEGEGAPAVFAHRVFGELELAGVTDNTFYAFHSSRGVEVHGFGRNEELASIDVFFIDFDQRDPARKFGKALAERAAKYLTKYLEHVREGLAQSLDDVTDSHDMAVAVEKALSDVERVRLFLVTNATSTVKALRADSWEGLPVSVEIWDVARLHRLATSGALSEPIIVELDDPLPVLATKETDKDYAVLLAIIPGQLLADLYGEFGTRMLELNVRSFLQTKGAVNRGIRDTLLHNPERFLAYNNGISATASRIDFVDIEGGGRAAKRIHDLQIVNGGQTTASIHYAAKKDKADLSHVFVQAKLTVVSSASIDDIVPSISKYSNTQNKVTVVDLSANHPFHVALEKGTRELWAPAAEGSGQETKWFYERARGQYTDALARERTDAARKRFQLVHPVRQKFLKSDVAKYENSWSQLPYLVSRGAEKNFRDFMDRMGERAPSVDKAFCQRVIAKAVLFKETERIVSRQEFGGYRANIVTYTIAKLANATAQRVDLDRIWREQRLTPALREAIAELCLPVQAIIVSPPPRMAHIGEWTKKVDCWTRVEAIQWEVPAALAAELVDGRRAKQVETETVEAGLSAAERDTISRAAGVAADDWFAVSAWAKQTDNLAGWQRQIAFSLGKLATQSRPPSIKQATQGLRLLEEAMRLGFRPDSVAG
jgi:hypothetical protein